jgi:hypothetical protein
MMLMTQGEWNHIQNQRTYVIHEKFEIRAKVEKIQKENEEFPKMKKTWLNSRWRLNASNIFCSRWRIACAIELSRKWPEYSWLEWWN